MPGGAARERNLLVEQNYGLVISLAARYARDPHTMEELKAIGAEALITAVRTYNPGRKARLSTFAYTLIRRSMMDYMDSRRRIADSELLFSGLETVTGETFDAPSADADIQEDAENSRLRELLAEAIRRLPEKQQQVIGLRYGLYDGCSYKVDEIARFMGLSSIRIRQLEKAAIQSLRNPVVNNALWKLAVA